MARREIAALYPGCFALVMATGIISNDCSSRAAAGGPTPCSPPTSSPIRGCSLATLVRACPPGRALWTDLIDPRLVFSFFTIVAGTDVFGIGISLRGFARLALAMWWSRWCSGSR